MGGDGSGTLSITGGGSVTVNANAWTSIGNAASSITVDGAGSEILFGRRTSHRGTKWQRWHVKYRPRRAVTATDTYAVSYGGKLGSINFGPGGGTLTTTSHYVLPAQFSGTGTVNTRGLVSDIDLVLARRTD